MTEKPTPTRNLDKLRNWLGRTQLSSAVVSTSACRRMQHVLDREATLQSGDRLPPLWHWLVHLESAPLGQLGRDGHAERGSFHPPVDFPRRMWAGSRFTFAKPIRLGDEIDKTSTIAAIDIKQGSRGPLCIVTIRHELMSGGELAVSEEQDLAYLEDPSTDRVASRKTTPVPSDPAFGRVIRPGAVMLFRYSALTFNSHRIHYDPDYCRQVEGYPGLVVHGPLTATLLADLVLNESGKSLTSFSFRAVAPLFDTEPFRIDGRREGDRMLLWATTPDGGLAMSAEANLG